MCKSNFIRLLAISLKSEACLVCLVCLSTLSIRIYVCSKLVSSPFAFFLLVVIYLVSFPGNVRYLICNVRVCLQILSKRYVWYLMMIQYDAVRAPI